MNFAPKHVVTMVVAISLAAVLTPVGVMAATGQLVNIVDPVLGDRKVRVGSSGALQVETRPGVTSTAVNVNFNAVSDGSVRRLLEVVSPTRAALSELTLGVRRVSGYSENNVETVLDLMRFVRTSGSDPQCGATGWSGTVLRRVSLKTGASIQLKFDGPPLIVAPGAAGQRVCLAARLYQYVDWTFVDIGATVFSYT